MDRQLKGLRDPLKVRLPDKIRDSQLNWNFREIIMFCYVSNIAGDNLPSKVFVIHLKFQWNWVFCILIGYI